MTTQEVEQALRSMRRTVVVPMGEDRWMVTHRGRTMSVDRGQTNRRAISIMCPVRALPEGQDSTLLTEALLEGRNNRWAKLVLPPREAPEPMNRMLHVLVQLLLPPQEETDPLHHLSPVCSPDNLRRMVQEVAELAARL